MGIQPQDLGLEIVTPGDPAHPHHFLVAPWDRERFGPETRDFDSDPETQIAFPKATYQTLLRCECGAEAIKRVRALI